MQLSFCLYFCVNFSQGHSIAALTMTMSGMNHIHALGNQRNLSVVCIRNKNANIHELFWGAKNTQLCAQYTVASRYRLHGSESIPVQQCNCRLWHYLKIRTIFESKLIETSCESQYKRSHSDLFLACPNSALENHSSTANTSAVPDPGCPSFVGKKPA